MGIEHRRKYGIFVRKQERKTMSIFRGRDHCDKEEGKRSGHAPFSVTIC